MPRSFIYVVVAVLATVATAFGYRLYQEERRLEGVEIRFDDYGIALEKR